MEWLTSFFSSNIKDILVPIIIAIVAFLGLNVLWNPILAIKQKRQEALKTTERYAFTNWSASQDSCKNARKSLNDNGSDLRSYIRGASLITRLYCKLFRYNLENAAGGILGLATMVGSDQFGDERRRKNRDFVFFSLRAHYHLSKKEINELKLEIEKEDL